MLNACCASGALFFTYSFIEQICVCQLSCSKVLGFPGGSAGKESACNVGDLGLIPGLGRSPGEENGYPLQYSGLELTVQSMGGAKSWTQLSDFHLIAWEAAV